MLSLCWSNVALMSIGPSPSLLMTVEQVLPMMRSLVTRLYLALAMLLLLVGLGVAALVDSVNRWRFESHLYSWLDVPSELIRDGLLRQPENRQEEWLGVLTALTGAGWQRVEAAVPELELAAVHWTRQQAEVRIRLDQSSALIAAVTDWVEFRLGFGYLLLNELSRFPVAEREQRLDALTAGLPFAVASVPVESVTLGFLGERQLARGQPHVRHDEQLLGASIETLYLPMGDTHVLKLGPWKPYNWLTPLGLLLTLAGTLILLAVLMALLLWPLKRRLYRFTRSVDRITEDPDSIAVPERPLDELGDLGHRVNVMAHRLAELVRRNQELNQAVSHDLKTPLARIRFALELMQPTLDQASDAEVVYQAVDELESLVNELLLFHRLSVDSARNTGWHEVELSRLLRQLTARCADARVTVTQSTPAVIWSPLDTSTLKRLLRNLLDNACHHARERVNIDLSAASGRLLIQVDDDGAGIPEHDRERVFEPFVRLDTARGDSVGGHGLGLSICRAMVSAVAGRIDIESSPSGGARVQLEIPLSHSETQQNPTNHEQNRF